MIDVLNRNLFFIKEHIGLLKAANNYDILDSEEGRVLMECREENLGFFTKLLRFSDYRGTTPFDIRVRTPDGQPVMRLTRWIPIFVSRVKVLDENDNLVGGFKQKLFSVSGTFDVLDAGDRPVCRLKGGVTGRNFSFLAPNDVELARVEKKWAGLGKELCTSAGNYVLHIDDAVPGDSTIRQLILASVICIGMVLKIGVP